MKIGIILSAVIVLLFAMVLLLNRGTPATVPTLDTSPDMLALQAVPADAPSLFTPANPQADADEAYRQALAFYQTNKNELVADPVPDAVAEQWGMLFVEAANAGQVSDGFLDKESVMTPAAHGPHSFALTEAPRVVLSRAQALYEEGKQERAIAMGRAIWALGLRGYTKNLRAHERLLSLWCMEMAHDALQAWLPADGPDAAALTYWGPRLQAINQPFQKKCEMLMTVSPNIGDIIRIANEDKDPTFRMEATLKLGVLQYAPKSKSNLKLMKKTFEQSKKDPHPQIAKAGEIAEAITLEQVKKMK